MATPMQKFAAQMAGRELDANTRGIISTVLSHVRARASNAGMAGYLRLAADAADTDPPLPIIEVIEDLAKLALGTDAGLIDEADRGYELLLQLGEEIGAESVSFKVLLRWCAQVAEIDGEYLVASLIAQAALTTCARMESE